MTSLSSVLAVKAMDGLLLRATAIAQNIANSNSPSYRLQTVDFESELRRAAEAGSAALAEFHPTIKDATVTATGDAVRLDLEMAEASATSARYAALSEILNRQMQISHIAIRGGQ